MPTSPACAALRGGSCSGGRRFETLLLPHGCLPETRAAFGWDLDAFVFFGGYPGAATLVGNVDRRARYVRDVSIETTLSRDVLLHARIEKPALLRRLLELGCRHSGQVLSDTKMVGQLQDAGNTTTLAHYSHLLAGAGMLRGLQKYAGAVVQRRTSSPKLQMLKTALMTAQADVTPEEARANHRLSGTTRRLGRRGARRQRARRGRGQGALSGLDAFEASSGRTRKLPV